MPAHETLSFARGRQLQSKTGEIANLRQKIEKAEKDFVELQKKCFSMVQQGGKGAGASRSSAPNEDQLLAKLKTQLQFKVGYCRSQLSHGHELSPPLQFVSSSARAQFLSCGCANGNSLLLRPLDAPVVTTRVNTG